LPYTERFDGALLYAARLHRDQTRKGTGVPYVTHLLTVAAIVGEYNGTEDEVIAALLHDAPEDAGGEAQLAEIRTRFGGPVADIVAGCTDAHEGPKPPWRARKEAYLDHLAEAPAPVRLVSAADKLHNARSVLCRTTGPPGKASGAASTAAGTARSGTIVRSRTRLRGTARSPTS
jgi:(p)ppGpp synthase/HD superfamily hydrolase